MNEGLVKILIFDNRRFSKEKVLFIKNLHKYKVA